MLLEMEEAARKRADAAARAKAALERARELAKPSTFNAFVLEESSNTDKELLAYEAGCHVS